MLWPAFRLENPADSWAWWAYQELQGKAYARAQSSKYQRERWHLRALHDEDILDSAALELGAALSDLHGQVNLRLGSIWVDLTPQATAKYRGPGKSRQSKVKCELADLVIVTMASFGGRAPRQEDVRAVLVQAKVTSQLGILDKEGPRSSSYKERNLLECCSSDIALWAGTDTSTNIGTFDLGCTPGAVGLARYSQYLTIPSEVGAPPTNPYQSMWPFGRKSLSGRAMSLGEALLDMLDVPAGPTIGCPLTGPNVERDWPRLIRTLTSLYDTGVVNRFTGNGATAFPRIQQSRLHSCFVDQHLHSLGVHRHSGSGPLLWSDMSFAFGDGGGRGNNGAMEGQGGETDGPHLPVILVQADIGQAGYEPQYRDRQRG